MNFMFFRKMEVVWENSFYGGLAEWTKASAMLNDVNRNSERSFRHRRFESCTLRNNQNTNFDKTKNSKYSETARGLWLSGGHKSEGESEE